MSTRLKKLKWNSILALSYQVILVISGLILPRCFLRFYGSEVNGLISSITQFLAFINICDLGISAVVSSAYYKPLAENDNQLISKIFVYSKKFFRVVGYILTGYIVLLLIIYPTVINRTFNYLYTAALIAAMGISQLGQYFIGITYQLLLNSDQKSYVQLGINGATLILNTITSIILMYNGASIQIVKLTTSLLYLLRPVLLMFYVKKHYNIDYTVSTDSTVVTQKKSGIIQHIAYMIYENTDVIVLTVFSTLKNVSIYSIYTLVTNSIKQIISAATTGVQALLGNMIANGEQKKLREFYEFYDWLIHTVTSFLFTVAGLLIIPFVKLYTSNITDADYYAPTFSVLILVAYYLSSIRNCNYVLIRAAGHYKKTQAASLVEAALNLTLSIICVFKFGLVGVAFGTLIATLYFVAFEAVYFSKNIVFIPKRHFAKLFLTDILFMAVSVAISVNVKLFNGTVISWIVQALAVSGICAVVLLCMQALLYRKNFINITERLKCKAFGK